MAQQYTKHKNTLMQTSDQYYLFQVIYVFIGKDFVMATVHINSFHLVNYHAIEIWSS